MFLGKRYSIEYMEFVIEVRGEERSVVIIAVMKVIVKARLKHFRCLGNCKSTAPAACRSGLKI